MKRSIVAASILSAAAGLAVALQSAPTEAAQGQQMEKCYGINAVAKNDCAEGAHSCAGQATRARDPQSYVLLPAGVCGKIQGGRTTAG